MFVMAQAALKFRQSSTQLPQPASYHQSICRWPARQVVGM